MLGLVGASYRDAQILRLFVRELLDGSYFFSIKKRNSLCGPSILRIQSFVHFIPAMTFFL